MYKLFGLGAGLVMLLAATPTSTNYTLRSYDIGSGGTDSSTSTNYKLNGISGAQSGTTQSSTSYGTVSGLNITQDANVPLAPTLTNPSNYYDRLKLVIDTGSNPTDTKYLIGVQNSSDGYTTTSYVQSDDTIGPSQAITNYQTYAAWGGASGFLILGLTPNVSYKVEVKALQGDFSGSKFSPFSSIVATQQTTLTVSLSTSLTGTPPFISTFTSITPGSVATANANPIVGFSTNAYNGGYAYVVSANGGLKSTTQSNTIASATADLSSVNSGYGAQVTAATQSSGGPLISLSPFNVSANNVGALTTSLQPIFASTTPITSASGTFKLMAKAFINTPPATDYTDTLTVVLAMNY
jgi:hypothetical protein